MLAGMTTSFLLSVMVTSDPTGTLLRIHQATPKIGVYQDWRMFRSPATLRRNEKSLAGGEVNLEKVRLRGLEPPRPYGH